MLDLFGDGESLEVDYLPQWLAAEAAQEAFKALLGEVAWRQDTLGTPAGQVRLPRLTAWQGDPGAEYMYSGIRNLPAPWTTTVRVLRNHLQDQLGARFNSVLLNRYRGGTDSIGWHADDESELGAEPVIARQPVERQLRVPV